MSWWTQLTHPQDWTNTDWLVGPRVPGATPRAVVDAYKTNKWGLGGGITGEQNQHTSWDDLGGGALADYPGMRRIGRTVGTLFGGLAAGGAAGAGEAGSAAGAGEVGGTAAAGEVGGTTAATAGGGAAAAGGGTFGGTAAAGEFGGEVGGTAGADVGGGTATPMYQQALSQALRGQQGGGQQDKCAEARKRIQSGNAYPEDQYCQ